MAARQKFSRTAADFRALAARIRGNGSEYAATGSAAGIPDPRWVDLDGGLRLYRTFSYSTVTFSTGRTQRRIEPGPLQLLSANRNEWKRAARDDRDVLATFETEDEAVEFIASPAFREHVEHSKEGSEERFHAGVAHNARLNAEERAAKSARKAQRDYDRSRARAAHARVYGY